MKILTVSFTVDELKSNPDAFCKKLNSFADDVVKALGGSVKVSKVENKEITIVPQDIPYRFAFDSRPTNVTVISIDRDNNQGSHEVITGIGSADWRYENGKVALYAITGVDTSTNKHKIKLKLEY